MTEFNLPDMTDAPNIVSAFQGHITDLKARYENWVTNFAALPESGDYRGQKVGVTSENKLYVWNGTSWELEKLPWAQVTGKPSSFTPVEHTHNASDINAGALPIARGGTGSTDVTTARVALGISSGSDNPNSANGVNGDIYFKIVG